MNKVVIFILCFAPFLLMGNALAWDGVPAWEKPLPSISPSPYQNDRTWENHRRNIERIVGDPEHTAQVWRETDYRNRHSSIYISGCHHYSESCRMQLRD